VTNLTGTASININGTVGATTASTGAFTTLAYTGTLTGGTGVINIGSGQLYKDASGNVFIGATASYNPLNPRFEVTKTTTDSQQQGFAAFNLFGGTTALRRPFLSLNRSRGTTAGTFTEVASGDALGTIAFGGSDGTQFVQSSFVEGIVDGTVSAGVVPTAVRVSTANAERMRIDSSGNVGIGTSSPSARLDVAGATLIRGDSTNATFTSAGQLAIKRSSDAPFMSFHANGGARNGYIQFGLGDIDIVHGASANIKFFSNTTERMRIDSAGNVGIGLTNPATFGRLAVQGDTTKTIGVRRSTDGTNASPVETALIQGFATAGASSGAGIFHLNSYANSANDWLTFKTTSGGTLAERMRITSAGNVGIGTSVPLSQCVVATSKNILSDIGDATNYTLSLRNPANANNEAIGLSFSSSITDTNVGASIYHIREGTDSFGPLVFATKPSGGNVTERMRITSAGNVGIGTSSPERELHVNSSQADPVVISRSNGTNANTTINFKQATTSWYAGAGSNNSFGFSYNNADITLESELIITSAGNVGIGTSSPGSKLSVQGDGTTLRLDGTINTSRGILLRSTGTGEGYVETDGNMHFKQEDAGRYMRFSTANTERMRIDSSGNLLVGATSGSQSRIVKSINGDFVLSVENTLSTNPYALELMVPTASANDTSYAYLICRNADGTNRAVVFGNGNIANVNNSYGAISDAKRKENVVDASPKLDKLTQVRIVNFNMIGSEQKQLGVIAQELEQIFPGMVEESPDRDTEGNDLGTTTKAVKYSVFVPMLIKAMQEQQALIEQLKARLDAANL
jgi:hypothetical protein